MIIFIPSIHMRVFSETRQSNRCKNMGGLVSSSTLLIPENQMILFRARLLVHENSLPDYLSHLLSRYRFLTKNGIIPKHEYLKTGYQKKNLNLQRVDFTPYPEDWAEMKCLKAFFNRSMTWIFVFLLLLDSLDIPENLPEKLGNFVVPKISRIRLEVRVCFSRKEFLYERILQMTRDRMGGKRRKKR